MDQRPEQPPEGRLIADAADRASLSIREAARRAGLSYGRWRQVTSGYQNVSPGVFAAVHAPAATLARMAAVVGVTPEQMESEGQRPDAAEVMRRNAEAPPALATVSSLDWDEDDLDLLPDMTPEVRRLAAAHVPAITKLVEGVADPDTPGAEIFNDPHYPDEPRRWNWLVQVGLLRFPGKGYSPKLLIWQLAVGRVRDDQRRARNTPAAGVGMLAVL